MKTYNKTYSGPLYTLNESTGVITGGPTSGTAAGVVVTPGSMIQGNFKDPNGWSYHIRRGRSPYGKIRRWEHPSDYYNTSWGYWGSWISGLYNPPWDRTLLYNRALERLNAKVRGGLDLGVDLAEGGQTFRMIKSLATFERFVRGGRWNTKDLANGWLQFQYGWKPLVSDIYDAADSTARAARKSITNVTGSASSPYRVGFTALTGFYGGNVPSYRSGSGVQSCRIVLTLAVRETDPGQWSSLNPVSLGWELIPYSFVIDWFYDVGTYLRNLETAFLYTPYFVKGYKSELYAYTGEEEYLNYSNGYQIGSGKPWETWQQCLGVKGKILCRDFARTVLTSYPFPQKPTFKVDLGSQRLFSAASLLRQLLK